MANPRDLARNLRLDVNTGTTAAPVWTEVKGLNTLEPSRSDSRTDTTGFDDSGQGRHLKARLDKSISFGAYLIYADDGTRDAGQQELDDKADEIGDSAIVEVRIVHRVSSEIMAHYPEATVEGGTPMGGGVDAANAFSGTITRSGADASDVGQTA